MKVITQDRFGGPEVLYAREAPTPEPGVGEVLVRNEAVGVNPVDWKTRAGKGMAPRIGDPPFTLGWDLAGVVEATGPGETRFSPGQRVFGLVNFPQLGATYAEAVAAPSRHLALAPSSLVASEAGALPLAGLTALQALARARLAAGELLLVHAAAGGVGHLAVQLARHRGARVIGTASAAKHEFVRDLGAEDVIDYRNVAPEDAVRDADVVLDLVGGDNAARALKSVRRGGRLVSIPSTVPEALKEQCESAGVELITMLVEPNHAGLAELANLAELGELRVAIEATYPLADAARAHADGERGSTTGKLVLVP